LINVVFLIADSSTFIRKSIRRVLESQIGAKSVLEAVDGEVALGILRSQEIDFIISGWEMAKLTGDQLLTEVRANPKWADIPFIMATSHDDEKSVISSLKRGVSDYIVKPFSAKDLEVKVRSSWNGAKKRKHERYYSIPNHKGFITVDGTDIPCKLVNLSQKGALVELEYSKALGLAQTYGLDISVEVESPPKKYVLSKLLGTSTRMELVEYTQTKSSTCHMGIWFGEHEMNPEMEKELESLLQYLKNSTPQTIGKN